MLENNKILSKDWNWNSFWNQKNFLICLKQIKFAIKQAIQFITHHLPDHMECITENTWNQLCQLFSNCQVIVLRQKL